LLLSSPTLAQENFIGSNMDLRTSLAFKVPDAVVQKMLPAGWEINSPTAGAAKGANLIVVLAEQLLANNADGKPAEPFRGAALVIPAKKKGTDTTGTMVIDGLFDLDQTNPYGVAALAQVAVERKAQTGADRKLTKEERWQLKSDRASLDVHIQFAPGAPTNSKMNFKVFSAAKPDFYRIYRGEQAVDVVRSTATGVDRVTKLSFKASGDKLGQLFDGTEQLINVVSVPWYSRQLYLPGP
jgi:hypothetical protein